MAVLDSSTYEDKFNDPIMGLLKDNTNREIVPARHRLQITDTRDSFVNKITDGYYGLTATTGTNDYLATFSVQPTAYIDGHRFPVKFTAASTGPATVNINGLGVKKIYKTPTTQAGDSDIVSGQISDLIHDTALDGGLGGLLMVSGGGTSTGEDYVQEVVDTTGDTITLDLDSKSWGNFSGDTGFLAPRTVVLANEGNAGFYYFNFEVTAVDVPIDFGEDTRSTSALFVDGVFTPQDVGLYTVHAIRRFGTDIWLLNFRGVYSVGDAPPTPTDQWILSTGIWNDSEFWDDDAIWKDTP